MAIRMKLLELKADKARILFEGEGNTYMNVLTNELLNDPEVDVAQYRRTFQFSDPELIVTTKGGRPPLLAVRDAAMRLSDHARDLLRQLGTMASD